MPLKEQIQRNTYTVTVDLPEEFDGQAVLRRLPPREAVEIDDGVQGLEDWEAARARMRAMLVEIRDGDDVLEADDIDFDMLPPQLYMFLITVATGLLTDGIRQAGKALVKMRGESSRSDVSRTPQLSESSNSS